MNKLYFLLVAVWLLSLRPAGAQTPAALRQRLNQVFANVDKSQVPTGRLLEYAEPLLPMEYFDGQRLNDTSRTTMTAWRALYVTAATARVAGSDTLPGLLTVNARLKAASPATPGAGAVPIAVEYVAYAALRHDAFSQNLLSIQNEQLYDVAGRKQSPYQRQVLFAAAPAYTFSPTGTVSFVFRRSLYLADGSLGTPTLYLDFDDGRGYLPAAWDQPLAASYSMAGTKHVKVKAVYRGNLDSIVDTRESHFSFEVLEAASMAAAARYASDSTSRGFTRLISPRPGVHGGALVSVRYGQGNPGGKQILKPLIVVEQYNIARTAPHLVRCGNANNTAESFLRMITTNQPFELNDQLDLAGYDLVYIDFTDNLDYLASNAQLFEEVVRWVNQKKAAAGSTQQNVVMGLSMGGLIARYGLAEMTRRPNDNPDTRLLVLHDSPQRGAYNPLGVQAVTRALNEPILGVLKLSNFSDEFSETVDVMDRGATRDLSILYATDATGGYTNSSFLEGAGSPYRQMVDSVPSPGYTIIATSDGSQCGVAQGIAPGTELSHSVSKSVFGFGLYNIIGGRSLNVDAFSYALPAYGQQDRLSHVRFYYNFQLLPWWLSSPIHISITVQPIREFTSPPNTLPYENLPGGTANLSESSACANSFTFYGVFINSTQSSVYGSPICFVPSYSALDVETVTPANAAAQYINSTSSSFSPPRVARYIAQQPQGSSTSQYNLTHLAYTARNGEWIFNEMQRPFTATGNLLACDAK